MGVAWTRRDGENYLWSDKHPQDKHPQDMFGLGFKFHLEGTKWLGLIPVLA